ncbi:MAG: YchF/TatD family DNA exonuclease [Hyperionvirus sp.]|uniref:YchF/TatD family DNA exonuclease n=1 Tax=Hyperionvirus sp. TaxID=2487770 RepID=A0A3G5A6Y8_9VIRU|nr:MAG: YchF/TatD family DNA exonuclease [Hyperionvirus sp.]
MVDIGANLTHKSFEKDLDSVMYKSFKQNLQAIIITGTTIEGSQFGLKLCEKYKENYNIFCTAGIHPHNANEYDSTVETELIKLIEMNVIKAVGECGLDFDRNFSAQENQINCFDRQIKLALKYKLPLFLHERSAHKKFLEVLDKYTDSLKNINVVVHCFTGNCSEVKEYIKRGFYIGITGWICDDRRNMDLLVAIKDIPLDKLMIETDSPFLSPNRKERRNIPANVFVVAQKIGKILSRSEEDIIKLTTANAIKVFNLELKPIVFPI